MANQFVGLGENGERIFLYSFDESAHTFKKVRQVLWGDWIEMDEAYDHSIVGSDWRAVTWAPNSPNRQTLFIKHNHITDERPLEIIFLDVGQGDGAVLISPELGNEEKIMVIDAGEGSNMRTFLNGRFKAYRGFDFEAAIITHPDKDHYLGFNEIFKDPNIGFKTIYQSGLVERPVTGSFEKLGQIVKDSNTGVQYLVDLAQNRADVEQHFTDTSNFGRKKFPPVMHNALNNPKIRDIKMLSTWPAHSVHEGERAYMPGFAPSDGKGYSIEVLGPVAENDTNGNPRLRKISSNYGKTKNGHSVILRLHFGKYKVLFGGDLNIPAEKYLLKHYTNRTSWPAKKSLKSVQMIKEASEWFHAEIMKVCHHGSEKVTDEFIQAVNPACFVISSGDQEGFVHPRPDLLGRLGKFGRGESPVLLSTELQRSTREFEDQKLVQKLSSNVEKLAKKPTSKKLKKSLQDGIKSLGRTNVDVYGAVYLKTDGERLITAFKFEEKSDKKKWFYFEYKIDQDGELKLC